MEDERERMFNRFQNLGNRLKDLSAIVQNEITEESVGVTIDQFGVDMSSFIKSLNFLNEDVYIYFEKQKIAYK